MSKLCFVEEEMYTHESLWRSSTALAERLNVEAKLEAIARELSHFQWRKGETPYQNVKRLEAFRDLVAHGKVQSNRYVAEQKRDGSHFRFEHAWDNYLTVDSVANSRRDVKAFCQSLLVAMRQSSDHPHLLFDAFEGPPGSGESSSNVG